jgi:hypothetical protein
VHAAGSANSAADICKCEADPIIHEVPVRILDNLSYCWNTPELDAASGKGYKVSSIAFERKSLTINLLRVFLSSCLVDGFHRVCDVLGFTLD